MPDLENHGRGGRPPAPPGSAPPAPPESAPPAPQATSTDPVIGAIILILIAVLAAVLVLAAGQSLRGVPHWVDLHSKHLLHWTVLNRKRLLHWAGELLLIAGILLAAKGIHDVRLVWTSRPGIFKRLWELIQVRLSVGGGGLAGLGMTTVTVSPSIGPTTEERIDVLEEHVNEMRLLLVRMASSQEAGDERLEEEDRRLERRMTDLAAGGLTLQTWGVACLLIGTILTAFW